MSKIDLVLLGLLMEKERHGYDILQQIELRKMTAWIGVSTQGVYKGLARLQANDMLEVRIESGDSHPDRNVYAITDSGRTHFCALAERSISEPIQPFFPLLWGTGFAHLLDRDTLLARLDDRRRRLKPVREELEVLHGTHTRENEHPMTAEAIIEYYIELIDMELAWMTRFQRRLRRIKEWPEGVCKR